MLSELLAIAGSSAAGSLIGGIFALFNKKNELEAKRLDLLQEEKRWAFQLSVKDKDLEYARLEAAGKKDVAVVEGDATVEAARMAAIAAANAADTIDAAAISAAGKWGGWLVAASFLNKIIRPFATIIFCTAALYLNWLLVDRLTSGWEGFTQAQRYDASMQALAWVTGQAGAALGYWFVIRGTNRR